MTKKSSIENSISAQDWAELLLPKKKPFFSFILSRIFFYPYWVSLFLLLIAIFEGGDYSFPMTLRSIVFFTSIWGTLRSLYKHEKAPIILGWAFIALLFNPISPVYLYSRALWIVIDILTIFFISSRYEKAVGIRKEPLIGPGTEDAPEFVNLILGSVIVFGIVVIWIIVESVYSTFSS